MSAISLEVELRLINAALGICKPAPAQQQVLQDDDYAPAERCSVVLSNRDVLLYAIEQIAHDCWQATEIHGDRYGCDESRQGAIDDLVQRCEDDLADCDIEDLY